MTDFLFFALSPALMALAAALLRNRAGWQLLTTPIVGLLILMLINSDGWPISYEPWERTIGGLLLDVSPILAVTLFLVVLGRRGSNVAALLLGVPIAYFIGLAVGIQIGMLLGSVQP